MDTEVTNLWIWEVLQPYLAEAPPRIHPVILLDSYRCHVMPEVVQAIENMGCQVEHIPPGCTPLCQPIDIGVCKPLKDCLQNFYFNHLYCQMEEGVGNFPDPSCAELAQWIAQALHGLSEITIQNSWKYSQFAYF